MSSNNNTGMNTNMSKFYVKEAYTNNYKIYELTHHLSVEEFIRVIQFKTAADIFQINILREHYIRNIQVIEAGQETCGGNAEDAPALEPSSSITMLEKYGDKLQHMAFYVKSPSFAT